MAQNRYAQLRNRLLSQRLGADLPFSALRDADSAYLSIPVTERLAQCIWYDQRVSADTLQTSDGRPLKVISAGWWNLEAGPDFHRATVQIGDQSPRTGDVEVHLHAQDWIHHGHGRDPLYDDVILHVVLWEAGSRRSVATRAGGEIPQVILQHHLSAPLEVLYDEIDQDSYPHSARDHAGRCAPVLASLSPDAVRALLDSAGDERFEAKRRRYSRWIERAGAEQAFYEGWMEALGYKGNKLPFRQLAQRLPLASLAGSRTHLTALLFGTANFLPTSAPNNHDDVGRNYVKRLWDIWWKLRPNFTEQILPSAAWKFRSIRPANHPHRRLGAAIALIKQHPQLLETVTHSITAAADPAGLFVGIQDDYWSHHFTLGGKTQRRAVELIGSTRSSEIVTNLVFPFVAALAHQSGDASLEAKARARFAELQPSPLNSIERLACQQLFTSTAVGRKRIRSARQQQGVLQIFQDFCLNDKSGCEQCQFPELARQWMAGASVMK